MFSPNDIGLRFPLKYVNYHGRYSICDSQGNELFLIGVVRPSIEAQQWLEEWGKAICDMFNSKGSNGKSQPELETSIPLQETPDHQIPVKRKRGRPRKNPVSA